MLPLLGASPIKCGDILWRLLSYLCLTTVPSPYKPSTRACQGPPLSVLRLFHTPLGYLNTNSKAVFLCRPNLILQSTGRPLVRSRYPEYNTKSTDTCVPTFISFKECGSSRTPMQILTGAVDFMPILT